MAPKGSKKDLSVEHEAWIAHKYGGKRSKSSGASDTEKGDVRLETESTLIECKGKFGERTGQKPVRSNLVKQMEKIADEAYAESKEPAIALRFWMPESPLAIGGYVDFTVRLTRDDAERRPVEVYSGGYRS